MKPGSAASDGLPSWSAHLILLNCSVIRSGSRDYFSSPSCKGDNSGTSSKIRRFSSRGLRPRPETGYEGGKILGVRRENPGANIQLTQYQSRRKGTRSALPWYSHQLNWLASELVVGEDWRLIDLANVEHGRVNREVWRKQSVRLPLSLIKNDPPGASSQRAASHSWEISLVPSVFLEKNNTGENPKTTLYF